jgi:hypothetical protein
MNDRHGQPASFWANHKVGQHDGLHVDVVTSTNTRFSEALYARRHFGEAQALEA